MKTTEITYKNSIIYVTGMVLIAFGVVFMLRSNLGSSSWDSLHYALYKVLPITIGTAMIGVALVFTAIVVYLNKSWKYLYMVIPIFLVGLLVDLVNLVLLKEFIVSGMVPRIITFIIGLSILPMGGALLIVSTYPAGVFDEAMLSFARTFHTNKIVMVRVIMELTAVSVALLIGLTGGFGFGKIHIGTFIFSITVGIYVKAYINIFERILKNEDK